MTTSGTTNFLPSVGELVLAAYRRVGVHRSEITSEHLADARNETNLMQAEWAALGPLLWTVGLQSQALTTGTPTYSVPPDTIMVLDAYISIPNGDGTTVDRVITAMSRSEYAAMPDKLQKSAPTSYWFDRLVAPTITLWPNPDASTEYTLNYYTFSQIQDATLQGALQPQIPYFWLDAYVAGLARRLKMIYPTENQVPYADFVAEAQRAYNIASAQGTEGTPLYIAPAVDSYWRA